MEIWEKIWKFDEKLFKFRNGFEILKKLEVWEIELETRKTFENLETIGNFFEINLEIWGKNWKFGKYLES